MVMHTDTHIKMNVLPAAITLRLKSSTAGGMIYDIFSFVVGVHMWMTYATRTHSTNNRIMHTMISEGAPAI